MALVKRVHTDEQQEEEFSPDFKHPTSPPIGDYACMDDVVAKATEFVTLQEQLSKLQYNKNNYALDRQASHVADLILKEIYLRPIRNDNKKDKKDIFDINQRREQKI